MDKNYQYDVIVVGGGIAGLISAAYLSKEGYNVLLCEKENKVGGLVNTFDFNGFKFDGGIRAFENSGIVIPMINQLGLELELVKNNVSVGFEEGVIKVTSKESLEEYKELLFKKFPSNVKDIEAIIDEIKKIMKYMDIVYGIENPLFLDMYKDKEYLLKTVLPWLLKFAVTMKKVDKLNEPVDEYLRKFTKNDALIDMIGQHFFKKIPTFFALSYFSLYLDYNYPKGGTGTLVEKIEKYIIENNGEIKFGTQICEINPEVKKIKATDGKEYFYKKLIWASDLKRLYNGIDIEVIQNKKVKNSIKDKREIIKDKNGGDSVLTLYLTLDLDKSYFEKICTEHFFYTPYTKGLSSIDNDEILIANSEKEDITNWLKQYYKFTTYEISIPVMRDESLAPKNKTGLIISTLMDYEIVKRICDMGWYDEFKELSGNYITNILENSIFPGIIDKKLGKLVSTPVTIEKITGSSNGAITGWAFTNETIPVVNKFLKVMKAIYTPIPDVYQVGQWSYSPSGLPISIFTGKAAADEIIKSK